MNVLVTGSRKWDDTSMVYDTLQGLYAIHAVGWMSSHISPFTVIQGGAPGADHSAKQWAEDSPMHPGPLGLKRLENQRESPVESITIPAEWGVHADGWCPGSACTDRPAKKDAHGRPTHYCIGAGPRRNQKMLDEQKPTLVLAFKTDLRVNGPGGTEDMVRRALSANLPVRTFGSYPVQPTIL